MELGAQRLARVIEPRAETALQEAIAWLETLARRTAEMHRAFASEREDPAFRPSPWKRRICEAGEMR